MKENNLEIRLKFNTENFTKEELDMLHRVTFAYDFTLCKKPLTVMFPTDGVLFFTKTGVPTKETVNFLEIIFSRNNSYLSKELNKYSFQEISVSYIDTEKNHFFRKDFIYNPGEGENKSTYEIISKFIEEIKEDIK